MKKRYKIAGMGDLRSLLEEQGYRCAMTGERLTPMNTAFDHIKPLSKGGTSKKTNLQAVTRQVAAAKSDISVKEFVKLCFDVLSIRGPEYRFRAKQIAVRKRKSRKTRKKARANRN
ncbi:MAG: HNH endonuclease [Spirochaetes bacterium]|nr:HNH endonuclease [Spirochaetota bacterium]